MGKSAAGRLLGELRVPVVDTDLLAREAVAVGSGAWSEIREAFGTEFFLVSGEIDRAALGRRIFSDFKSRSRLESILHPRIFAAWQECLGRWSDGGERWGVVLIPLLFEKGYETEFDAVIAVACSAAEQQRRLLERGWSESEIVARNTSQWPVEEKIRRSHYLVWTEGDLNVHRLQWKRVLAAL